MDRVPEDVPLPLAVGRGARRRKEVAELHGHPGVSQPPMSSRRPEEEHRAYIAHNGPGTSETHKYSPFAEPK